MKAILLIIALMGGAADFAQAKKLDHSCTTTPTGHNICCHTGAVYLIAGREGYYGTDYSCDTGGNLSCTMTPTGHNICCPTGAVYLIAGREGYYGTDYGCN